MEDHTFVIPESGGLNYKVLRCIEENGISYEYIESGTDDQLLIRPRDYIKVLPELEKLTGRTLEIKERYRSGQIFPLEVQLKDHSTIVSGSWEINTRTGEYINQGTSEKGELGKALMKYGRLHRNGCIDLSRGIQTILAWGTVEENILLDLLQTRQSYSSYLHELLHCNIKLRFTSQDPKKTWTEYITNPAFPRSVPWNEGNEYGIWVWPERYYRMCSGNSTVYPDTELVLDDSRYWDREIVIGMSFGNKTYQVSGNPITILYNRGLSFSLVLNYSNSGSKFPVRQEKITPEMYLSGDSKLKAQVEDIFSVMSDRGLVTVDTSDERRSLGHPLREWMDIGLI